MDRDIKFRGKRADNGEWVYGDLLRIGGGCIIYFGSKNETQTPNIPNSSPVAVELFNDEIAVVIPDTVSQFTGLFGYKAPLTPDMVGAKADQEAYYGDNIRFVDTDGRTFVKELWWSEELQCTMVGNLPYYRLHESGYIQPSKLVFQIVGNIHDKINK